MSLGPFSYAGNAQQSAITGGNLSAGALSFSVSPVTGWPSTSIGPFMVKVDGGSAFEEKMIIGAYDTVSNLTVIQRGADGTTAQGHLTGAPVIPCWDALSAQDANNHIYITNLATRDDHTQYLSNTRHDITSRHTFGAAYG